MGHIGNEGNGIHGVWVTLAMGPMGNGDTVGNGVQGIGYIGNETHRVKVVQGVWGTWPIRPTGGMGYKGMGYRGYGAYGQ